MKKDWGSNVIEPSQPNSNQPKPTPPQQFATNNQPAPSSSKPVATPQTYTKPAATPQTYGKPQPPPQTLHPQVVSKFAFPFADTHTYKLVCSQCLARDMDNHGIYHVTSGGAHECAQNVLAVQRHGARHWIKIRERLQHRAFPGKYALCRNFCADPPLPCNRAEDLCSFAHSHEEQRIWGLEKDGMFSVKEFITQNRDASTEFGIRQVLVTHGGMFHFLCHYCFFSQPARIAQKHQTIPNVCGSGQHPWPQSKQLMHIKVNGPTMAVEPISHRPFPHLGRQAFFNMCVQKQYCNRRRQGACNFAHSMVERDLWLVERDTGISREEIERESKIINKQLQEEKQQQQQPGAAGAQQQQQRPSTPVKKAPEVPKCPFRVFPVCSPCHKNGIKSVKDPKRDDRCSNPKNNGHMWSINKMYLMRLPNGTNKELRSLPDRLPKYANFIVCQHVIERGKCTYHGTRRCQFAHSEEERQVWTYMYTNKGNCSTSKDIYILLHVL